MTRRKTRMRRYARLQVLTRKKSLFVITLFLAGLSLGLSALHSLAADVPGTGMLDSAPAPYPTMEDPALTVSTIYDDPGGSGTSQGNANNLVTPIGMVFL